MKQYSDIYVLIDRIRYADGNIGEEAVLTSLLQDLEACGITHITVLSNQPDITRNRHGDKIRVISDNPRYMSSIISEVKKSDLLIWGGGHMLQDRSSQLHIPSVVKTLLAAKFLRVARFIYAPGLGPVVNNFGKILSKHALGGARTLIVRDVESMDFLKSIGIGNQAQCTADPAFSLHTPYDEFEDASKNGKPVIGFAPRKLFYRKGSIFPVKWQMSLGKKENPRFERHLKESAAVLDQLIEEKGVRIQLIPMDVTPNPRDDLVCIQLKDYMKHSESVEVWDDNPGLDEFVRRLRGLDLLVSSRLHGIILGLRFGLPFIGIDSDGKIERVAASIGYKDYVIKDFDFNRETFLDLASRALNRNSELREDLLKHGQIKRERSNENYILLKRCLQAIGKEDD